LEAFENYRHPNFPQNSVIVSSAALKMATKPNIGQFRITDRMGLLNFLNQAINGVLPVNCLVIDAVGEDYCHSGNADHQARAMVVIKDPALRKFTSAMVGKHTHNPADYTLRRYHGRMEAFLRREHAIPVECISLNLKMCHRLGDKVWYRALPSFHYCDTWGEGPLIMEDDLEGTAETYEKAVSSLAYLASGGMNHLPPKDVAKYAKRTASRTHSFWRKYCLVAD